MSAKTDLVKGAVLRAMRPLARLLIRNGVTYPGFVAALKRVFLDAARDELAARGMNRTDSAITLLSGVHRRDVRELTRTARASSPAGPAGPASEVVGRWMSDRRYLDRRGRPRVLPRGAQAPSFDTLVEGVSRDVRPRALLDELLRLGVVVETDAGIALHAEGFAPRAGLDELAALFAANLHDHAAAASRNLDGEANFLEQAVFVDEITEDSARRMAAVSAAAWKAALKRVMAEAQQRFDADAVHAVPAERRHRARFGVYFYSEREGDPT